MLLFEALNAAWATLFVRSEEVFDIGVYQSFLEVFEGVHTFTGVFVWMFNFTRFVKIRSLTDDSAMSRFFDHLGCYSLFLSLTNLISLRIDLILVDLGLDFSLLSLFKLFKSCIRSSYRSS